jgi:ATP-binding protein involved in chromosome partitioning
MAASLTKEHVIEALRTLRDARSGRDLYELGAVRKIAACDGYISIAIAMAPDEALRSQVRGGIDSALRQRAAALSAPITQLNIEFVAENAPGDGSVPATAQQPAGMPMKQAAASTTVRQGAAQAGGSSAVPGVKHVIAVGAGKGGVGKSTVSVNLAVGLARGGHSVGLLDGDIYGPSVPTLLGLAKWEVQMLRGMLQPFYVHGIKTMTIGKLVDPEKPLIWRGPMAHGAFKQLTEQTEWGDLDYLIVDLPPGTGDVSLTMAQMLSVSGAVIVCTPQKVAQDDAVRAARMFQTLSIPVLGVVENMSYFIGDDGKEYDLFGRGGAEQMAQRLGLPFLGTVPIHMELRINSDAGDPTANFTGNPRLAASLEKFVTRVESEVALATLARSGGGPVLTVS